MRNRFGAKWACPGRIASQIGPMVEVHDHCGSEGEPAALFGFVGWPHELRATNAENLKSAIIEQLTRCFGQMAQNIVQIQVEDWAKNPFICSNADLNTPPDHPTVMPEIVRKGFIGDQVFFASAETAIQNPGLIRRCFRGRRSGSHRQYCRLATDSFRHGGDLDSTPDALAEVEYFTVFGSLCAHQFRNGVGDFARMFHHHRIFTGGEFGAHLGAQYSRAQ